MSQLPSRDPVPARVEFARRLRRDMTPAEAVLWKHLRGRRFDGWKFRRQQPVGRYVADFFCSSPRLILELDGESHVGKDEHDATRQAFLEGEGYAVLRFWNHDVYDDRETVLDAIWAACDARRLVKAHPSPPTPLPQGERGARHQTPSRPPP